VQDRAGVEALQPFRARDLGGEVGETFLHYGQGLGKATRVEEGVCEESRGVSLQGDVVDPQRGLVVLQRQLGIVRQVARRAARAVVNDGYLDLRRGVAGGAREGASFIQHCLDVFGAHLVAPAEVQQMGAGHDAELGGLLLALEVADQGADAAPVPGGGVEVGQPDPFGRRSMAAGR
jgi:hypothetical protein